jgi:hypothetical protein
MTEVKRDSIDDTTSEYDTYEDRVQQFAKTVPVNDEILYYPDKIIEVQIVPKQVPKGLLLAPV